jgi:type I protein arginine methyltransferase
MSVGSAFAVRVAMKHTAADLRPQQHARRTSEVAALHRQDDDALLGQYIPLHYHGQMLADERRMAPFHETIAKLVPLGSHVVELGGGTGVMSFFASKRARKVTTVERLPHVAAAARRLLSNNGASDRVTVIEADARNFVPDEPADVVICEMLHAALLRERQLEVLQTFKARHEARFGRPVPLIIPEATILGVQPVFQPYEFHGYYAPVTFFFEAGVAGASTIEMGAPKIYSFIEYTKDLPDTFPVDGVLTADRAGTINALRFITKNVVGVFPTEQRSADWHMPYMSIALPEPIAVEAGDDIHVRFQYDAGASIEALQASVQASHASGPVSDRF